MKVFVSGSKGLIGQVLCPVLTAKGHIIKRLVREKPASSDEVMWNPATKNINIKELAGAEAVIHLAGENVASGRWTEEKKQRIRTSRVEGTKFLSEALASMDNPPKVLVYASAIGYYGDSGDKVIDENSPAGSGFLASVCQEWEAACTAASKRGIRVVNLRIGIVLSRKGGALAKMLPPFLMGAGGIIGNGKQFMSCIAVDEIAKIIDNVLDNESLSGPVNAVMPESVTNQEFTQVLGKILSRPTIFPVPAFGARLIFGEMADELLLASCRVKPSKLVSSGYQFSYPRLEEALKHVLGK